MGRVECGAIEAERPLAAIRGVTALVAKGRS